MRHARLQHAEYLTVANGYLVSMRLQDGRIVTRSTSAVGHWLEAEKAVIVDDGGNPIEPKEMLVRQRPGCNPSMLKVIDPGKQYKVCFDPNAPGHFAIVEKIETN